MTKHNVKNIAKIAYEVVRSYCESVGDYTVDEWDKADKYVRDETILKVEMIIDNMAWSPEHAHEVWLDIMIDKGWIHGDVISWDAQEHPHISPYESLPQLYRITLEIFWGVVKELHKDGNE